jgi:hypothetical protein
LRGLLLPAVGEALQLTLELLDLLVDLLERVASLFLTLFDALDGILGRFFGKDAAAERGQNLAGAGDVHLDEHAATEREQDLFVLVDFTDLLDRLLAVRELADQLLDLLFLVLELLDLLLDLLDGLSLLLL